jgi:hypothetical protein
MMIQCGVLMRGMWDFPHERQSTDVTTQQYCNSITSGVFSWSVHTQQSVAMQRMTQLRSDQSGFQWVGPEPIKGMHKPNLKESQSDTQ